MVSIKSAALVAVLSAGGGLFWMLQKYEVLSGLSDQASLGDFGVQAAMAGFCLGPVSLAKFEDTQADDHWDPSQVSEHKRNFSETGELREDEYVKDSIYAFLYSLYRFVGKVRHTDGSQYQFTFNTWGISNPGDKPFGPEDPQRHGKAAYYGLATFDKVNDYISKTPGATMLEIGCGTGAGANLITRSVHKTINYIAVDMQMAGIETCRKIHATPDNPNLQCVHSNGKALPVADKSVDIVIVSETHIAEVEIGEEEKKIFAEIIRVLKPGGLFLWGNALPTKVWGDGDRYLQSTGFSSCGSLNHTSSAILARDEDEARVNIFVNHALDMFKVLRIPIMGPKCRHALDRIFKNFCRQPGTDLYNRMVVGHDSYMHLCYTLEDKQ